MFMLVADTFKYKVSVAAQPIEHNYMIPVWAYKVLSIHSKVYDRVVKRALCSQRKRLRANPLICETLTSAACGTDDLAALEQRGVK